MPTRLLAFAAILVLALAPGGCKKKSSTDSDSDSRLAFLLGDEVDVGGYRVRPPKGYTRKSMSTPPEGVAGQVWHGERRSDGTTPLFVVAVAMRFPDEPLFTLDESLADMLDSWKKHHSNWSERPTERTEIGGLTFAFREFTATDRDLGRVRGAAYSAVRDRHIVGMVFEDTESHYFQSLPAAMAAIQSIHRGSGPLPPSKPSGGATGPKATTRPPLSPVPQSTTQSQTQIIGNQFDPEFRDVAPAGGLLVGFEIYCGEFGGEPVVHATRPIYRVGNKDVYGRQHGVPQGPTTTILARPDYAIGAISAKPGLNFDGFSATFMRVTGDRLDPLDAYESEWVGWNGPKPKTKQGNGTAVIGIVGRKNDRTMSGLGLLFR